MPALPSDPASPPEADGGAPGSGRPPSPAARALDELRHAAQAADALCGDASAALDLELEHVGRSLERSVRTGVRHAVLTGATTLAAVAGGVLVCLGAGGWIASSLQLGLDATRLLEGSALLAGAGIAAGGACFVRRRRQAALLARRRAARQALAASVGNLTGAVARAADPRPWVEQHPFASLAVALAAGVAAGRAAGRDRARPPRPASPPDAETGETAPRGGAEARTSGSALPSELGALVLALGMPLVERLFESHAPPEDADD